MFGDYQFVMHHMSASSIRDVRGRLSSTQHVLKGFEKFRADAPGKMLGKLLGRKMPPPGGANCDSLTCGGSVGGDSSSRTLANSGECTAPYVSVPYCIIVSANLHATGTGQCISSGPPGLPRPHSKSGILMNLKISLPLE